MMIKGEIQMFIFSIPDANVNSLGCEFNIRLINWGLLETKKVHPEWFYDDFIIETAYGCPSGCIWNGNRGNDDVDEFDDGWADAVVDMYKSYGVEYRLIFTNFMLKKEHLQNKFANKIALDVSKKGGYVTVSTNMMAQHMKRYPGLKLCWSTTTNFGKDALSQIKKINELSEKNLVVLPYEFNNKPELEQFIHPENLEVLVNEKCIDNCPYRRKHWTNLNTLILKGENVSDAIILANCHFNNQYKDAKLRKHNITRDMLGEYEKKGINHFKISGRIEPILAENSYQHYFVRPECRYLYISYMQNFLAKFCGNAN